ncbi:putative Alpha-(1,3)-fucosyltransferase C [Hypsibius exemplaris]|uniref:Fucosyltransferase n=1 Tax=Hypsibius exemplaris TaxID=2072580 RepID=A0A1W0XAX1_HYPEX|nr:putative Alpha-(1,3)-fucosyltransferase C [Hypsibius exemplaris]
MCQRFTLRRFAGLAVLASLAYFTLCRLVPHAPDSSTLSYLAPGDTRKVILFWTKFFDDDFVTYMNFDVHSCPVRNCLLTSDRGYLRDSSAVVFHGRNLDSSDLPAVRSPSQSFVFYLLEAPYMMYNLLQKEVWLGFFNLTWTYRQDSDVLSTYYFRYYQPNLGGDRNSRAAKKNRAIALISNCGSPSNRDVYIAELQRYFPVDVAGRCGTLTCPKGSSQCSQQLSQYKFYLAFENGLCLDYVTEKAYRAFSYDILPIVLGGGNYSALLPPNSFLNVADFATPKQLAERLHVLSNNPDEYEKHFIWKQSPEYSRIPAAYQRDRTDICKLCEILNRAKSGDSSARSSYADLHDWLDYMDHLQASLATLLFPPTHRAWPENFESWRDRFRAVLTKQFVVVTVFQLVETCALLALWTFLLDVHVPVLSTLIAVISWTVARIICHVCYYVFILFPFYISEWEDCCRRRGLIAKMEIIRMGEELGGYFCPKLRPRLERIRDLIASATDRSRLRAECGGLIDHLLSEAVGTPNLQRTRTQKHRLQSMISTEKDLLRAAQREAIRCMRQLDSGVELRPESEHMIWDNLVHECQRLAAEWDKILLACLTHQKLPMCFIQSERDIGLAQYPEMFQKLVKLNDLRAGRATRSGQAKGTIPQDLTVRRNVKVTFTKSEPKSQPRQDAGFGEDLDFEPIS